MEELTKIVENISPDMQKKAISFVSQITTKPSKEIGGMLTDTVKYWRFSNQLKILEKSQKKMENAGLNPKEIPLKIIVPFLEGCSLEEDISMQEKWSNLLQDALTSDNQDKAPYTSFIEILKQLTPIEAKLLDIIYKGTQVKIQMFNRYYNNKFNSKRKSMEFHEEILKIFGDTIEKEFAKSKINLNEFEKLNIEHEDLMSYIDNYTRLNIIRITTSTADSGTLIDYIRFSTFGKKFMIACKDKY